MGALVGWLNTVDGNVVPGTIQWRRVERRPGSPRVFKTRWFERFARKEKIRDPVLVDAVARAEGGQVDADLGGGVIKQRIARP